MVSALGYDPTPGNNTTIGGVASSNTMNPATLDDTDRALAASQASMARELGGYTETTGSSNAYLFAGNGHVTALAHGARIGFRANHSCTGAATIDVTPAGASALGAKAIRKFTAAGEAALVANDIRSGGHYDIEYDTAANSAAGAWILKNPTVGDLGSYQPLDSDLTAIAALSPSNDDLVQRKAGAWTNRTIAQLLSDLAAAGTTFQPLDGELTALAGLTSAADKVPYFTGSLAAALTDLTSVARTLIAQTTQALMRTTGLGMSSNGSSLVSAADYAAMKALLDLEIGTDVQAYDGDLATIAGLTATTDNFIQSKSSAWASRTPAQVLTDLLSTFSGGSFGQLAFPATQNASAGANTLDDYEEGTWTPTFGGSTDPDSVTYATQQGRYTKIGRFVHLTFELLTSAATIGSGTGSLRINGAGFTVGVATIAVLVSYSGAFASNQPTGGRLFNSNTGIFLNYRTTSNGASAANQVSDLATGASANSVVGSVALIV